MLRQTGDTVEELQPGLRGLKSQGSAVATVSGRRPLVSYGHSLWLSSFLKGDPACECHVELLWGSGRLGQSPARGVSPSAVDVEAPQGALAAAPSLVLESGSPAQGSQPS